MTFSFTRAAAISLTIVSGSNLIGRMNCSADKKHCRLLHDVTDYLAAVKNIDACKDTLTDYAETGGKISATSYSGSNVIFPVSHK